MPKKIADGPVPWRIAELSTHVLEVRLQDERHAEYHPLIRLELLKRATVAGGPLD
jgi:hypothetical protein